MLKNIICFILGAIVWIGQFLKQSSSLFLSILVFHEIKLLNIFK